MLVIVCGYEDREMLVIVNICEKESERDRKARERCNLKQAQRYLLYHRQEISEERERERG